MTAHNGIVNDPSKKSPFFLQGCIIITDKFKAENDTITTFFKNLKIKFNTDEGI